MSQPNLTEDLNIVANSNIEITLLDGDLNIIQKLDDEPNDVGGLTAAELKAKFDEAGNIIKAYINGTLIPEILAADATEEARAAAEESRVTAEAERQSAEEARASAEATRQSNEENRESNEAARVAADALRVSAETAREQAESGRVTAEQARAEAESLRASAEELRASAEQARAAAEQNRAAVEQNRVTAEQGRATAEQNRVAAEQERARAETARDAAEQAREAAEQARADENTGIVARATEQANIASSAAASAGNSAAVAANSESAAASAANSASGSAEAASASETNAKASETAAKASEEAAKASETAAKGSETTAKSEADRAKSEADRAASIVGGDYATRTELSEHTGNADIHVTVEEKEAWSKENVFIATYGVTTQQELIDAFNAGKTLFCKYNNNIFTFRSYMNGDFFDFYWPYKYGNSEDGYLTDGYRVVQMNGTGVWSSYGVTLDFAKGNKWNLIQTGKDQSHEIASFDIYNEFLVEITTNALTYNFHLLPESFRDGGKNFMQGHYISDNYHGYCYISATKVILSSERYVVKCEDISFNGNKITDYTVNIFAR